MARFVSDADGLAVAVVRLAGGGVKSSLPKGLKDGSGVDLKEFLDELEAIFSVEPRLRQKLADAYGRK